MKKTITMLLLTALCVTAFASCDLGNGLVAELFGDVKDLTIGEQIYPFEDYIVVGTDMIVDIPAIEIETTLPYEIETAYDTIEDYWTEDVSVDIEPVPDVVYQLDLTMDGDLSDWDDGICEPVHFGKDNTEAWVGELGAQEGFTLRMAADTTYVYFAIEVLDDELIYSDDGAYGGDSIQMAIDLNCALSSAETFERSIFYSFGLQKDGTVDMTVQCIYSDAASDVDYIMASDDAVEWREGEVMGVTRVNDDGTGWIAEFAISLDTLYRDMVEKLNTEEISDPGYDLTDYFKIQMLICYVDRNEEPQVECAYGTPKKIGVLTNGEGWYPEYAGVMAYMYLSEGYAKIQYPIR